MINMRPAVLWLTGLCCFLAAAAGVAADNVPLTQQQMQSLGIAVAPLAAQPAGAASGFPAQVVIPPAQVRVVSAPVAGLIQGMTVAASDKVKKGQVLARLQSPMLIETQREFLQAATQAQLARENMSRDEKLLKEGIIAESRYLAAKSSYAQAAAALAERRQTLRLYGMSEAALGRLAAGSELSSTVDAVAPIDGTVLEQLALPGQRAEAAAPLYKVARLAPLWLEIQLPVANAAAVAVGAPVSVPAYGAAGRVLSVGRNVNAASQTITLRAEVTQGAQSLHPGQMLEAMVRLAGGPGKQWRVPTAAVVRQQERAYVFVQTPSGFRVQEVTVLHGANDAATIAGELRGDERIAVHGLSALKAAWMGVGEQGGGE